MRKKKCLKKQPKTKATYVGSQVKKRFSLPVYEIEKSGNLQHKKPQCGVFTRLGYFPLWKLRQGLEYFSFF